MTSGDSSHAHVEPGARDHETSDVNVRAILTFVGVLFVTAVVIHVLIWLLFVVFERRENAAKQTSYPLAVSERDRVPPEPRLQTHPREDLRDLRAREDALLQSYGWVDHAAGVVRIPIDEAMRLTIERGLPVRQDTAR
jgi:hypothetical protein